MATEKRCRKDRRDGYFLQELDGYHVFLPYLMPNRADCEAFINEQVDLTNLLAYLEQKNAANPGQRYTMFHVIAAAIAKTITLRPQMNRFISGKRIYQRKGISLSFVAKKEFSDHGEEGLLYLPVGDEDTIDTIHAQIHNAVSEVRGGKTDNSIHFINILAKLPRWLLRLVMGILMWLDYHGHAPYELVKEDPNYSTVFISNLGSIRLNAGYHHLNNWGNNSVFVVIGAKHKAPVFLEDNKFEVREVLNLGITLDERIADGYYYSKTIRLLQHLLQNPVLLEQPLKEEVNYD